MPLEWNATIDMFDVMGFESWVDGQPIGAQVQEGALEAWVDGQPIEIEVDS